MTSTARHSRRATRSTSGARSRRDPRREHPRDRAVEADAAHALRDRAPLDHVQGPGNVRSPQDHAGVIHSSNLCTEITLNTGHEETAVCNLGSIAIEQHLTRRGRDRPHEAARDDPRRRPRTGLRDRRHLLSDRADPHSQHAPPPDRSRGDGPAVRPLSQGLRLRQRAGCRVQRRDDGGDRLPRLRGIQRPGRPNAAPTRATPARSGTADCCRPTPSTCSNQSAAR